MVGDNGNIPKDNPVGAFRRAAPRLQLERSSLYPPELNPDEGIRTITKRTLANGLTGNTLELDLHLTSVPRLSLGSQRLLRACITHSVLSPFFR